MGKRKSSGDSDKIRRKIKKLQKKLKKKEEEAPPPSSSSGADTRSPSPVERATLGEPQLITEPVIQIEVPEEDEIPSDFLTALGSEGLSLEETGQAIHQQLVARWGNIIVKGLTKDAAATIIKKYPTPSNFKLVVAPEMNPEIVAAFSEPSIKRDKRIMARQNALGKTITCTGQIITNVMRGNINSKEIIEKLSDAAKITAEVIHQDSKSRKFFALSGTTSVVKEALKNAKTEGMLLFGTDCADKIRAAQAMQKTATQIKENIERYNKNQKKLNWKSPLPQQRRSGPSTRQPAKPRVNQQQNTPRARQQTAPRARQQRRRSPPQRRHHRP